jgi:hypothetical protein
MEFLLIFVVAGGLIWALLWAANGRNKNDKDKKQ